MANAKCIITFPPSLRDFREGQGSQRELPFSISLELEGIRIAQKIHGRIPRVTNLAIPKREKGIGYQGSA